MSGAPRTPRLEKLDPATLDHEQRAVYDAVAGGPRARGPQLFQLVDDHGGLEGPFNAMLLQPRVGMALQSLGSAVRYQTTLSERAREIAILIAAACRDSDFERYAHEAVGRHAGLTDAELDAIRNHDHEVFAGSERVVATTTYALVRDSDLDDEAYDRAVSTLGLPQVYELVVLVGYYDALALQLRVFRVPAPSA